MKNNSELVGIFLKAQRTSIRNSVEYVQREQDISSQLLEKAKVADATPVIVENVSYGVREALSEDFRNAGYHVQVFNHSSIAVSINFD